MRKILFLLLAMTGFFSADAQNLTKIKTLIEEKKFIEANTALDELLKVPKSQKNHEVYYLKTKALSGVAASPELRKTMPGTRLKALDAFKKALELEKNETMLLMNVDKYEPVVSLYTLGFEEGADHYNKSEFEESYATFKEAAAAGEFIFNQGWGLYKMDTTLTLYLGLSALNAKKEDEAVGYFTKIADENIGGTPDRATPYRFLAKYYYDKKDEAKMKKYMDAGLKLYPLDDYLPQLMIESVRDKNDMGLLLNAYKNLLAINPNSYETISEYARELFVITHLPETPKVSIGQTKESVIKSLGQPSKISKTTTQNIESELLFYENDKLEVGIDLKTGKVNYVHEMSKAWLDSLGSYEDKCALIESLYNRALDINPNSIETQISLGKHFYNQMLLKEEDIYKIKGQGAEQTKKREEINAAIDALGNKAIPQLESVFNYYDKLGKLKVNDKSNFKSACTLLTYCYNMKKDKAKADFYQKKYDEADKAHE